MSGAPFQYCRFAHRPDTLEAPRLCNEPPRSWYTVVDGRAGHLPERHGQAAAETEPGLCVALDQAEQAQVRHAVDGCVVHLGVNGELPVLQALDQVHFPRRWIAIEQGGVPNVAVEVEVVILFPVQQSKSAVAHAR